MGSGHHNFFVSLHAADVAPVVFVPPRPCSEYCCFSAVQSVLHLRGLDYGHK